MNFSDFIKIHKEIRADIMIVYSEKYFNESIINLKYNC